MLSLLRIPLIQRLYVLDRWSDAGIYLQDSKNAAPILYQITVLLNAYCERLKLWGGNSFNREGDPILPDRAELSFSIRGAGDPGTLFEIGHEWRVRRVES